jgi:hypothetical protein
MVSSTPRKDYRKRRHWLHMLAAAVLVTAAGFSGLPSVTPIAEAGPVTKPSMPATLRIPDTPIVSGSARVDLGYLPGSGSVSTRGQYTYTIPIEVPAGRAGMQPSLALVYSSSNSNGVLGEGWSMSGLSVINRCHQTLSTEGVVNGVHMTGSPVDVTAALPRRAIGAIDQWPNSR